MKILMSLCMLLILAPHTSFAGTNAYGTKCATEFKIEAKAALAKAGNDISKVEISDSDISIVPSSQTGYELSEGITLKDKNLDVRVVFDSQVDCKFITAKVVDLSQF